MKRVIYVMAAVIVAIGLVGYAYMGSKKVEAAETKKIEPAAPKKVETAEPKKAEAAAPKKVEAKAPPKVAKKETVTIPKEPAPTIVIQPSNVLRLDKKTQVVIMGSGFKPGQEVRLVINQKDGSISDISSELDPEPKADEFGVWATAWTIGDYASGSVAGAGGYIMKACDESYQALATVPFGYYDAKRPYKEWPSWARALVKEPAPAPAKTPEKAPEKTPEKK